MDSLHNESAVKQCLPSGLLWAPCLLKLLSSNLPFWPLHIELGKALLQNLGAGPFLVLKKGIEFTACIIWWFINLELQSRSVLLRLHREMAVHYLKANEKHFKLLEVEKNTDNEQEWYEWNYFDFKNWSSSLTPWTQQVFWLCLTPPDGCRSKQWLVWGLHLHYVRTGSSAYIVFYFYATGLYTL